MIAAKFVQPAGAAEASQVAVEPGEQVRLRTEHANGAWKRIDPDGGVLAFPELAVTSTAGQLAFHMDRLGAAAGRYQYTTADGADRSVQFTVSLKAPWYRRLRRPSGIMITAVALYIVAVISIFWLPRWIDPDLQRWPDVVATSLLAHLFALATLILALTLINWAGHNAVDRKGGLQQLFQGTDRRASTSKTQFMLWAFGLAYALAYIGGYALVDDHSSFLCADKDTTDCVPPDRWQEYLILIGAPAAAAVVAKGVTAYKVIGGQVQKTTGDGPSLTQIATNDNGQADIADVQYLLFNIVAFTYVAITFAAKGTLIQVPDILLALTSTSAATYVLGKSLQTNKPTISSVVPSLIMPQTEFWVAGQNLFPDSAAATATVKVAGLELGAERIGNRLRAIAPAHLAEGGDPWVSVVTSALVETARYPVEVRIRPAIIAVKSPHLEIGKSAVLLVKGIRPGVTTVDVTMNDQTMNAVVKGELVTTATLPNTLSIGEVTITVVDGDRVSAAFPASLR